MKTAILVDGGFYRRMAQKVKGVISAEERAAELENYCYRHLKIGNNGYDDLYRVFYYDCMPTSNTYIILILGSRLIIKRQIYING